MGSNTSRSQHNYAPKNPPTDSKPAPAQPKPAPLTLKQRITALETKLWSLEIDVEERQYARDKAHHEWMLVKHGAEHRKYSTYENATNMPLHGEAKRAIEAFWRTDDENNGHNLEIRRIKMDLQKLRREQLLSAH